MLTHAILQAPSGIGPGYATPHSITEAAIVFSLLLRLVTERQIYMCSIYITTSTTTCMKVTLWSCTSLHLGRNVDDKAALVQDSQHVPCDEDQSADKLQGYD
jgi:hypothetical protein